MQIGKIVLFVCAGAGIAWLASALIGDGDERSRPVTDPVFQAETDPLERPAPDSEPFVSRSDPQRDSDAESTDERETPFPSSDLSISDSDGIRFVEPSVPDQMTAGQELALSPDGTDDSLAMGESADDATTQDSAAVAASIFENLIDPTRIRCVFSAGGSIGSWTNGNLAVFHGDYQGGPIVFDSVNIDSGTARMTGSVGATGSRTGEVDVRVTATGTGLHFSGFLPNGTLLVTTIFGATDESGRYMAAMSRHRGRFPIPPFPYISTQTYGTCD